MKGNRLSRNLWLFAGLCFLVSFILNLTGNKSLPAIIMNGLTCILMFINAYVYHRKAVKENKDQ